jgi:hypothetical protein
MRGARDRGPAYGRSAVVATRDCACVPCLSCHRTDRRGKVTGSRARSQIGTRREITGPEQRIVAPIFQRWTRTGLRIHRLRDHVRVKGRRRGRARNRSTRRPATSARASCIPFMGKFAKLAARCSAHLHGGTALYPAAPPRRTRAIPDVPAGLPNLAFGAGVRQPQKAMHNPTQESV